MDWGSHALSTQERQQECIESLHVPGVSLLVVIKGKNQTAFVAT